RHSPERLRCLVASSDGRANIEAANSRLGRDAIGLVAAILVVVFLVAGMMPELEAGFLACRGVARLSASNFACINWLLPVQQRRGMQALYAFARRCDDIADSSEPLDTRREKLAKWRQHVRDAMAGRAVDPVLVAVADTVSRFVVPQHLLWRIIDGVEM